MWRVRLRGEIGTGFWYGELKAGYHLEDWAQTGRIIMKWIVRKLWELVNLTLLLGCFYLLYVLYSNLSRVYCC